MESEDEKPKECFLRVEKTQDGYVETSIGGHKYQYVPAQVACSITVGELRLDRAIDSRTGAKRSAIAGVTLQSIRAIGSTSNFPIRSVRFLPGDAGGVTLTKRYSSTGTSRGGELVVAVSEVALSVIVEELENAESPRAINLQLREGSIFSLARDGYSGVVLPWLEDQPKVTKNGELSYVFELPLAGLSITKLDEGPVAKALNPKVVRVAASASLVEPVGIFYSNSRGERHPLEGYLNRIAGSLEALVLIAMAGVGLILLFRFWR